jgi:hypothetical protein
MNTDSTTLRQSTVFLDDPDVIWVNGHPDTWGDRPEWFNHPLTAKDVALRATTVRPLASLSFAERRKLRARRDANAAALRAALPPHERGTFDRLAKIAPRPTSSHVVLRHGMIARAPRRRASGSRRPASSGDGDGEPPRSSIELDPRALAALICNGDPEVTS